MKTILEYFIRADSFTRPCLKCHLIWLAQKSWWWTQLGAATPWIPPPSSHFGVLFLGRQVFIFRIFKQHSVSIKNASSPFSVLVWAFGKLFPGARTASKDSSPSQGWRRGPDFRCLHFMATLSHHHLSTEKRLETSWGQELYTLIFLGSS